MRWTRVWRHGPLCFNAGDGPLRVGRDLLPMAPSNHLYYDSAKLRHRLDADGYLYLKNIIPRAAVNRALEDVAHQMLGCGWTTEADRIAAAEKHGFALGIPFPRAHSSADALPPPQFTLTDPVKAVMGGTNVMSLTRQVFSGAVECLPHHTMDFAPPHEVHGFRMGSVFMNRGTKLALLAWIPLHDTPLHMGGLCVVKGSNSTPSYQKIRESYGQMDVEGSGIHGDGCLTRDANELLPLGKRLSIEEGTGRQVLVDDNPMVTTTFEAGDVVLMTVYTMYGFLTNQSHTWRVSCESKWIMEGDDVGPDPRYSGQDPIGLAKWLEERDDISKYPKSMQQAKRDWGLVAEAPAAT